MNCNALSKQAERRIIPAACAAALTLAFAVAQPAHAVKVTPPPVVDELKVLEGTHAFLVGHAFGTQNYICTPSTTSSTGVAYALFTPEATLFNDDGDELITHFFSPNPDLTDPNTNPAVLAAGAIRATWQDSRDASTVWAKLHPNGSVIMNEGSIPWLLLDKAGVEPGMTGGDRLTKTTQIQRLNTNGGVAPASGCESPDDVGHQAFIPYTADYFFYTKDQ